MAPQFISNNLPDNIGGSSITFHRGTYKEAQEAARKDVKFLCVLLLSADHPGCSTPFLTSLLTKDTSTSSSTANSSSSSSSGSDLPNLLAQRCVIWAADVDEVATDDRGVDAVVTTFAPIAFPYFAFTFKNKLMMEIQGSGFTADRFKEELNRCFDESDAIVARELAFSLDRRARDAEREAQEKAERELLEADRKKLEENKRRQEEKERQEREEKERLDRLLKEAEERQKLEEERKREAETRKALAVSAIPDVPNKETTPSDQIATIRLTLLRDGKTAQRLFYRSTPLSGLYAWAESLPEYDMSIDGEIELMAAGNPPKVIERSDSVTIGETKALIPRCVVTMKRK